MRISDWSSDVCSSDLDARAAAAQAVAGLHAVEVEAATLVAARGRQVGHDAVVPAVRRLQRARPFLLLEGLAGFTADEVAGGVATRHVHRDRKSTRLNSSH